MLNMKEFVRGHSVITLSQLDQNLEPTPPPCLPLFDFGKPPLPWTFKNEFALGSICNRSEILRRSNSLFSFCQTNKMENILLDAKQLDRRMVYTLSQTLA